MSEVYSPKSFLVDLLIFYLSLVVFTPVFGYLLANGFKTNDYVTIASMCLFTPPIVGLLLNRRVIEIHPALLLFTTITDVTAIVSVISGIVIDSDPTFVRISIYIAMSSLIGVMTCMDVASRSLNSEEKHLLSNRLSPFVMMLVLTFGVFTPAITGGNIVTNFWFLIGTQIAFVFLWGWVFNIYRARQFTSVMKVADEPQKKCSAVFLHGFATYVYRFTLLLFLGGILLMNVISRDTFRTILQESPFTYIAAIYPLSIAFYVMIGIIVVFFVFCGKFIKRGSALESGRLHKGRYLVLLYVIIIGAGVGIGFSIYSFSGVIDLLWVAFIAQVGIIATVFALLLAVSNRPLYT